MEQITSLPVTPLTTEQTTTTLVTTSIAELPTTLPAFIIVTPEPPAPVVVTATSQSVGKTAAAVSISSGSGTSAAQAARVGVIVKLAGCNADQYESEQSDFVENPFRLSIGNSSLKYDIGLIAGNHALMVLIAATSAGVSLCADTKKTHFPGMLSVPVMFLLTPTLSSAMTLTRLGDTRGTRAIGHVTIIEDLVGTGIILCRLIPSNFHAILKQGKWIDIEEHKGFVKKYGLLFDPYRKGRAWFIVVELLMNGAAGVLAGFIPEQAHCEKVGYASIAIYGGYAVLIIILKPYTSTFDTVFFSSLAWAETVPLVLEAIKDTEVGKTEAARYTASWAPIGIYMAITLRTVYEVFTLVRFCYGSYRKARLLEENRMDAYLFLPLYRKNPLHPALQAIFENNK